jgi:HK97 family phage prohead protease
MGYQHRDAVGKWSTRREDEIGLYLEGPVSDTSLGRDALTLAHDGVLTGLSVGFWPRSWQYAEPGERVTFETPFGTRSYQFDEWVVYVLEAELAEASLVIAPSDDEARLIRTRSARVRELAEAERASEAQNHPAPDGASAELLARMTEQLATATRTLKEG